MRKIVLGLSAATLVLSVAACGGTQPENNVAADDMNAMANMEELPPAEPATNVADKVPAAETSRPESAAAKPTLAKPASSKPKPEPEPTTAKPAPAPAAEPTAPTPDCPPEHHAAGHC